MTFLHSGRVWVWVRGGYIYLHYPSRTRILKFGKTQTQSNRGWFGLVPMGTGFVAMPTYVLLSLIWLVSCFSKLIKSSYNKFQILWFFIMETNGFSKLIIYIDMKLVETKFLTAP